MSYALRGWVIVFVLFSYMAYLISEATVTAKSKGRVYSVNLHGKINPALAERFKYFSLKLKEHDTAKIHIESFGGYVVSMRKIIYYLRKSKGRILCTVDSHAASAAAIILMNCHKIRVTPKAEIMFHVYRQCSSSVCRPTSPSYYPKIYAAALDELEVIIPLLTKEERSILYKGKNVTLTGKDLMSRLRGVQ